MQRKHQDMRRLRNVLPNMGLINSWIKKSSRNIALSILEGRVVVLMMLCLLESKWLKSDISLAPKYLTSALHWQVECNAQNAMLIYQLGWVTDQFVLAFVMSGTSRVIEIILTLIWMSMSTFHSAQMTAWFALQFMKWLQTVESSVNTWASKLCLRWMLRKYRVKTNNQFASQVFQDSFQTLAKF